MCDIRNRTDIGRIALASPAGGRIQVPSKDPSPPLHNRERLVDRAHNACDPGISLDLGEHRGLLIGRAPGCRLRLERHDAPVFHLAYDVRTADEAEADESPI